MFYMESGYRYLPFEVYVYLKLVYLLDIESLEIWFP